MASAPRPSSHGSCGVWDGSYCLGDALHLRCGICTLVFLVSFFFFCLFVWCLLVRVFCSSEFWKKFSETVKTFKTFGQFGKFRGQNLSKSCLERPLSDSCYGLHTNTLNHYHAIGTFSWLLLLSIAILKNTTLANSAFFCHIQPRPDTNRMAQNTTPRPPLYTTLNLASSTTPATQAQTGTNRPASWKRWTWLSLTLTH